MGATNWELSPFMPSAKAANTAVREEGHPSLL